MNDIIVISDTCDNVPTTQKHSDNDSNKTSNSDASDTNMRLTANEQTLLTSWCTYCHENSELHYSCWSFYKLMNNIQRMCLGH